MTSLIKRSRSIMKNKSIIFLVISICTIFTLAGCSQYEKDLSYDTDLYGTYSKNIEGYAESSENISWINDEKYILNKDNTYEYSIYEVLNDETTKDLNESGKIISVEKISNSISKITLDQEFKEWSTGETSNKIIYKYKNILGYVSEAEIPNGETFELRLSDYVWFDEEGQYHLCNGENCQCSGSYPKYVRKNNIIYLQSIDEEHSNCYTIGSYIVDGYLFSPELYKAEE